MSALVNRKKVVEVEYNFAIDGGGVGDIDLRGHGLPAGAIVTCGMLDVLTEFTSGGAATVAMKIVADDDLIPEVVLTGYTAGIKDVVPDGSATHAIKTTANSRVVMTVGVAALTAGKAVLRLDYYSD